MTKAEETKELEARIASNEERIKACDGKGDTNEFEERLEKRRKFQDQLDALNGDFPRLD
jgi:hypothetical protein